MCPLGLPSFFKHDVFLVCPYCSLYQCFIHFYGWVVVHFMVIPHFVYPPVNWHLTFSPCFCQLTDYIISPFWIMQLWVWTCFFVDVFYVLGIYLGVGLLSHLVTLMFNFLGLFHGSCTILYSYEQCTRVSVSTHSGQYLLSIF